MDSNVFLSIILGFMGAGIGLLIGKFLFSNTKLLNDLDNNMKQERLRAESRISKLQGDLNQANIDLKHGTFFISIIPQLYNKLKTQETPQSLANLLIVFYEKLFEARQIAFFVFNPVRNALELVAKKGLPDQIPLGYTIKVGEGKIGWVAQKRLIMNENDFETETYMVRSQLEKSTTVYFKVDLCAPVTYFEELLGVVSLGNMVKRTKIEKILMQMTIETAAPFMRMAIEKALSQQPTKTELPHETEKILEKSQFISKLDQRIEEMRMMSGGTLAVAFMEVDNYHLFVQSHGINSGENALKLVGKLLISATSNAEAKSRFEEALFCVLFLNKTIKEIYKTLDSLRQKIEMYNFPVDTPRESGHLSVSCGLGIFPHNAESMDTLLSFALQNARSAHSAGGNMVRPDLRQMMGMGTSTDFLDVDIINAFEE